MSWRRRAVVDAEIKHVERPACRPATGAEVEEGGEGGGAGAQERGCDPLLTAAPLPGAAAPLPLAAPAPRGRRASERRASAAPSAPASACALPHAHMSPCPSAQPRTAPAWRKRRAGPARGTGSRAGSVEADCSPSLSWYQHLRRADGAWKGLPASLARPTHRRARRRINACGASALLREEG